MTPPPSSPPWATAGSPDRASQGPRQGGSKSSLDNQNPSNDHATQMSQNAPGRLLADKADGRSLREKFNVDSQMGGLSLSIPIQTSPGRSGFGPVLSLEYNSGTANSNGVFGLGWSLAGVDRISRKTTVAIPTYDDDEDIFVHSGVGDLVPVIQAGETKPVERDEKAAGVEYRVRSYRSRVESTPVRIEYWRCHGSSCKSHWKVMASGGVTTIFGSDTSSQISSHRKVDGSEAPNLIFSWLVSETYDSRGNHMIFSYKRESPDALAEQLQEKVYEAQRSVTSERYLKSIKYGNQKPNRNKDNWAELLPVPPEDPWHWMFEVVFDYGEHAGDSPTTQEATAGWALRPDPFSNYTSGFEVRTHRRCQRVLMFHHFKELGRQDCPVAATEFRYQVDAKSGASILQSSTVCGHQLDESGKELSYHRLPSSDFEYWQVPDMADVPIEEIQLDLSGFSTPSVQWVDLNGDGAPGILTRVPGGGWYYHQNYGGDVPAFSGPSLLQRVPSLSDSDNWSFEDLTGDGHLDVMLDSSKGDDIRGFYEHKGGAEWSDFVPFQSFPVGNSASDPAVHKIDLVGNGCADLLRLELQSDNEYAWYPSLGREGYGSQQRTKGAPGLPSAPTNLIMLCDMVGDGLSDMVLLSNSHICYWPNMGHGVFGPQVTMGNAPFLADYASFSPQRIRMVDITGTGTSDLVYLPPEGGVRVYYNQSGNSWSDVHYLATFPALDNTCLVDVLDIGARGTQCLCWISDYTNRGPGSTTVRFLDLTGGNKPGLLKKSLNGVGGQIEVSYRSSTQYYNEDRCAGEQWATRLPFPVHCVERVITTDVVAQTTHTMRYAYHNGYYDPFDRQFRGFQMVEEWDAEDFVTGAASAGKFQRPPVHTKTWYYIGSEPVDAKTMLPRCYLPDQPQQAHLSPAKISAVKDVGAELIAAEVQEAYRALAGQQRRQEIFSTDDSPRSSFPYLISQQTHEVLIYQGIPRGQRYGIFRVNDREELTCHYERDLKEALVQHSFTLKTDQYGNICKHVVVHYGKLSSDLAAIEDQKKQKETVVLYEEIRHTNSIDPLLSPALDAHDYFQVPLPSEVRHFRVLPGSSWACSAPGRYSWETLSTSLPGTQDLEIHETPPGNSEKGLAVLVSKSRTVYSKKDLTGPLPLHKVEPYSVEYQSAQLAFNHKMLEVSLKDGATPLLNMRDLVDELSKGCYVQLSGEDNRGDEWWVPSSRRLFKDRSDDDSPKSSLSAAQSHFYISNAQIDPFGNVSHQELDDYRLLATKSIDAAKNTTVFSNSYIHLLPILVTDVNGNRTQTSFDACGRPVGVAVLGKEQEALGDSLDGFMVEPSEELLMRFIADPSGPAATQLLGNAGRRFIYHDRLEGIQGPQGMLPSFQAELVRDMHHKDESGKAISCQIAVKINYFDGHGQVIQQASLSGSEKPTEKWRLSGWVIRDNKRQPVKQFLPSLAATHNFRAQADGSLAPATMFLRDPLNRLVSVVNADHTWTKTRFDAWKQVLYDEGDTVTIDDPAGDSDVGRHFAMLERQSYSPAWLKDAKTAAEAVSKSRVYGDTPTTSHTDVLGRQIVVESDNGVPEEGKPKDKRVMRSEYDLRGNVAQLRDELDRVVSRIDYDLLGRPLHSISMDSGSRWSLPDCQGSPFLSWTSRGNQQRIVYDKLRRVECVKVRPSSSLPEVTVVKNIYGETQTDASKNNLRGELYQCFDQSGVRTNKRFDFRGNCVESSHKYAVEYRETLDWSKDTNALETDEFSTASSFNAVGLVLQVKDMKDDSEEIVLRTYDVASRIKTLKSLAKDGKTVTSSVDDVQYDEDDKITAITYGNGSLTTHEYDAKTRRLVRTIIKRTKDKTTLEDITYMYDCVGKVIKKTDSAQQMVYFDGEVVSPSQDYRYNALGQLTEATGREQVDINNSGQKRLRPYDMTSRNSSIPGDGRQMIQYIETYEYDLGGNMRKMVHAPRTSKDYSGWTRTYSYDEASCIAPQEGKPAVKGNRLSSTSVGNVTEAYQYGDDAGLSGCMTSIPGYSVLIWDHNDKLRSFSTQKTTKPGVTPEMTWYVYDAQGRRVRKVTDRASTGDDGTPGARIKDTRYLAMRDIFTTYRGDGSSISNKITTTRVGDASLSGTPMARVEHDASTGDRISRYQTSENLELDDAAQVVSYEEFSPYGASTYHALIRSVPRKHRFMSYERDSESGLYACGARYYAPWLGRWTSPDPIGTGDGLNVYAYVSNDPVNMNDHQGTAGVQKQTRTRYHSYSESGQAPVPFDTQALSRSQTFGANPRATSRTHGRYDENPTRLNPDHVFDALDRGKSNSALRLFESKVAGPGVPFVAAQPLRAHASGADGAMNPVGLQAERYVKKFSNMSPGMVRSVEHEFYFHNPQVEKNTKSLDRAQQTLDNAKKVKERNRAGEMVTTLTAQRVKLETGARDNMDKFRRDVAAGPPSVMSAVLEGLGAGGAIANKFSLYYNDQPHESGARKDGILGDADKHHSLSLHLKGDPYPFSNFHVEDKTMRAKSWFLRL